jgi:hypothetical protein
MAFKKSIQETIEEEEIEELKEESTENENEEKELPDHPMEPCENTDSDIVPKTKKRPTWLEATLQDAKRLKVPEGTFRKSKRPKRFSSYAAYMTKLLDEEPTTFEEAVQKGQWEEVMTEEHQSIMKNEVWEIIPRPKEKSVVTSKWVYKIKHAADESVDKYKARFVARGFSQKEGEDYDDCYRTVCRKGLRQLESRLKTGVTGASPPTVTSMGSSFYLGWLVQGRRPYVIWVLEGLRDNGSR